MDARSRRGVMGKMKSVRRVLILIYLQIATGLIDPFQ